LWDDGRETEKKLRAWTVAQLTIQGVQRPIQGEQRPKQGVQRTKQGAKVAFQLRYEKLKLEILQQG
jgi:hypothetical protein